MAITMLCHVDNVSYKEKPKNQVGAVQNRFKTSNFMSIDIDKVIKALESGQTIALANCEDRKKDKFKAANSAALDFDNGHSTTFEKSDPAGRAAIVKAAITGGTISKQEVIDRCREKGFAAPTFIYSTFSAGQYIQDCLALAEQGLITAEELDRIQATSTFRAVWVFDHTVNDPALYTDVCKRLRKIFPESDPAFKIEGVLFGTKYSDTQRTDEIVDITTIPYPPQEQESSDPEQITVDTITASTDPPPQQGFRTDLSAADTRSYSAMSQSDSQRRNIEVYLQFLSPSMLSDAEWINVANAMKTEGFSYSEFDRWSNSGDPRYDEASNRRRWDSLEIGMNTGGTIAYYAKTYGHMTAEALKAALYPQGMKPKHTTAPAGAAAHSAYSPEDFKGVQLTPTSFAYACELLKFNFKWDVLKHKIVYYGFSESELKDTLANTAATILKEAFTALKMKKITPETISDCMLLHATRRAFNPVLEIINGTQWDGVDRLNEIYSMWNITDDFDRVLIHKWLIQCYCMLHNELDGAFGAEYTLVFKGAQGAGKTQFFKHLALHDEFFKEGATLDPNDKDSRLEALSTWICELGELGSTMKKDIDMLKAEMTRAIDIIRPPYARTANEYPRRTSFCATVNDEKFLLDTTGNRRWGIIRLDDDLKVPYSTVKKLDSLQLWAQIAVEVENKITATKTDPEPTTYENAFRLTPEELDRLLKRSVYFVKPVKAQDEVADIIELMKERVYNDYVVDYKPQSATEFKEEVRSLGYDALKKYSSNQIATALEVLGYKSKVYKVNGKSKRGYLLPYHRHK